MKLRSGKRRDSRSCRRRFRPTSGAGGGTAIREDAPLRQRPDGGCTSPAAGATYRWPGRNEVRGEVRRSALAGRPPSPRRLSPLPAGIRAVSYSEHPRSRGLVRTASLSRVGRRSLRPVLKHGPRSLTCARANGCTKPRGAVKAKGTSGVRGTILRRRRRRRSPGALQRPRFVQSSKSAPVGTRKMVNYAWPGRSQGKPWWRTVAILTCKSIVGAGYRGERLIEPSSSWFLPKFPSG